MKITLNKEFYNQVLFIICVVIPFFNNYELSFVVWSLATFVTLRKNYYKPFVKYLAGFLLIFMLSIIVGFFYEHEVYFVIRDITYMLKPILGLIIGYQLFSDKIEKPFRFLVYAGVAIASYHLLLVGYGIVIEGARNVRDIRFHAGYFNDFEVYIFVILLFWKQFDLGLTHKQRIIFLTILGLSSFFYLARTNFIQFIILVMAVKGLLILTKRSLIVIVSSLVFIGISYALIYSYNPKRNGKGIDEFLYKIKVAPIEAFSTRVNKDNWKEFNDNYRSYENIRTVEQLTLNKTYIFGEGVGAQVDLKKEIYLGDMLLRKISILHNGYMTVFLKTGIVGVIIYLYTIFFFFKRDEKKIPSNLMLTNINYLFVGTGVFLIFSNWVFMGFYNLVDTKSLFIGFLFAYKNRLLKNNV
ncbi:hypothetical protein [Flavobacterium suncheonense]|uniref:hypothetical protein n=1 Tax=Flavobacterium suncheonense TaxID=350894 RepID=UPI003FA3D4C2